MNASRLIAAIVACALTSVSYAKTASLTSQTAPDAVSKDILKTHYISFHDGASGPSDVAAAIDRNFADVIEHNLAAMSASTSKMWLDQMSDRELADLAQLYANSNAMTVRTGRALDVLAARLDVPRLGRLAEFFGTNEVNGAALAVAPAKFNALSASASIFHAAPLAGAALAARPILSQAGPGGIGATPMQTSPTVNWTLSEIYLNFRTLPVGSLSVQGALYETAMYSGKNLVVAWGSGYAFGSEITDLMQTYAPTWYYGSFVDVVGGTPYEAIDWVQNLVLNTFNFYTAALTNQLGNYQAGTIPTMGASSSALQMMDTGGDLGMEYEFEAFEGFGGGKICVGGTCAPIKTK